MLRSLMAAIDGTPASDAVLDLAIRWGRRFDALVVGMTIVDEPGLHGSEEMIAGETYFHKLNEEILGDMRRSAEQALSRAAVRCAEAGVAFKPLEEFGSPVASILNESQRFDLILLSRQTHFRAGYEAQPDGTALRVLRGSPRPVVVVPPQATLVDVPVSVAYDGSFQAASALGAFVASGLGRDAVVHILAVGADDRETSRRADRAVEFLRLHGFATETHVVKSSAAPGPILLERARALNSGLLVMGACGKPMLRELLLGSTTRTVLAETPIPLFLHT
ncbi:MAG: universal stress protein [Isosphaeraceae bacterium]